ncbi:MAG: TerB family tellurite resistance protein [Myxococcales bacterium]|nr:TerB family tellurite resistance protein [Myxococcales bacterium]
MDTLIQRARRLEQYHVVKAGELVALGGTRPPASVSAVQLRQACETAALLGYAVEPDARVVTKKRTGESEMLIWRVDDTRPMPATTWRSVHTMLSLMLSVAAADGVVGADEVSVVASFIEELFVMDDLMRSRVEALRHLITRGPAKAGAIAKTLQTSRTRDELLKIGRVLVAVAGADGVISDNEHASLRTLYKGLGLTPAELSAAVIASGAQLANDVPVSVQPAEAPAPGQLIPPPRTTKGPALDSKAIAAILAETREVAALLSAVLDSDDDESPAPTVAAAPGAPAPTAMAAPAAEGMFATLDLRYQTIVQQPITKPHWSSAEVRTIATGAKLMPGAIVETVNAWSDDQLGDYLIDESDGWQIRAELLERATA